MSRSPKFRIGGKQVLLLGLAALVITAGYYRWTVETDRFASVPAAGEALPANAERAEGQTEEGDPPAETSNGEGEETAAVSLSQLRQERDTARSETAAQWEETAKSREASQEAKAEAEKKLRAISQWAEKEKAVETLIKAKGYTDCFAQVGENSVSVVVTGGEVNGAKVAQMKDVIVDETGVAVKNIKISAQ